LKVEEHGYFYQLSPFLKRQVLSHSIMPQIVASYRSQRHWKWKIRWFHFIYLCPVWVHHQISLLKH